MAVTPELTALHDTVDQLRSAVGSARERYGDIVTVRRLIGDVERLDLDISDLDGLPAPNEPVGAGPVQLIDDTPADPSLWADADDEGIGGYHHEVNQ
jgi:hypothetical protein